MPRLTRLASGLVLLLLSGCMSWHRQHVVEGTPPAVSGRHPVRVTRSDHSMLVLEGAGVVGDSLVGSEGDSGERVAVALRDITQVEERRVSALRTTGVVAGTVVATVAVLTAAAFIALLASLQ